jgi:glucose-1-phosphate cytidylyltransferase
MKVVILAGGLGTRISEETISKPKPMVEIAGKPIIWHIMKYYSHYGYDDFIICLGYKGHVIKDFFANYKLHLSDVYINYETNHISYLNSYNENWKVTLIDTGAETQTGGRLLRVKDYLDKDESFHFTYGDGLSDVNIHKLVSFHKSANTKATMTIVRPPGRYGAVDMVGNRVTNFREKPQGDGAGYINGGYFILNPSVLDLLIDDKTVWEQNPLIQLASSNQLAGFRHDGFWQAMDTLREKNYLENLVINNQAPWILW